MILTDFDQDAYEEMLKEEALKQGKTEALLTMVANMRKQGLSEEVILSCTGLTEEQLKALEE